MEGRILQLISALRASGVRVSLAESADAFSATDHMGVQDREAFRRSLRATLIKDARDLPVFDKLFPLFFGRSEPPMMNPSQDLTSDEARMIAEALRQFNERLQQQLDRLMKGRPLSREELDQLAKMVGLNNAGDMRYQNWMAQRMARAMDFPEVREALEQLMQTLREMGMNRRRVGQLQTLLQQNQRTLEKQLSEFAGMRLAENLSRQPREDDIEALMNRPFRSLTDREKKRAVGC
jgi:uncharacterized protein with von Willebrand factor type A (vWA) domain